METTRILYGFLYVLIAQLSCVDSSGIITLTTVEYDNPTGRLADGACCDGVPLNGRCFGIEAACDHQFTLCVSDTDSFSTCTGGSKQFYGPQNTNNITSFEAADVFISTFETWTGSFILFVNVTEEDTAAESPVDFFMFNYTQASVDSSASAAPHPITIHGTRAADPTQLRINVKLSCDRNSYGPDCSVTCVPADDCKGHYTCDNNGAKVCRSGWHGTDCTELDQDGPYVCPITNAENEFLPSVWDGSAVCPNRNRAFVINITNVDNTTGSFLGQLFIDHAAIPGFGTRFKTSFTFHSQNNVVNYTGTDVTSFNINEKMIAYSSMQGIIQLSGIVCTLTMKRRSVVGDNFGCANGGQCIRVGNASNDYYCCCGQEFCPDLTTACSPNPCHNGVCNIDGQGYLCSCLPGFTGTHCATRITSTMAPTTPEATTIASTTPEPTTMAPTTPEPTTMTPTTPEPTTMAPTTTKPTTMAPTTPEPTTTMLTTPEATTMAPTMAEPTTTMPTTPEAATMAPTTPEATTMTPTMPEPTTAAPTTPEAATMAHTTPETTTMAPTTPEATTIASTTPKQATMEPTTPESTTMAPTIPEATTIAPTTSEATTVEPTTPEPTTMAPTTPEPTTMAPTTPEPTTMVSTTPEPTTMAPTTPEPTTMAPTTLKPTTMPPTTPKPTTMPPTTPKPTTMAPTTEEPTYFDEDDDYSSSVEAVDEEYDKPSIVNGLKHAWAEANKDQQLEVDSIAFRNSSYESGIGQNGISVIIFRYRVRISRFIGLDFSRIVKPTALIERKFIYNYTGLSIYTETRFVLLNYYFSLMIYGSSISREAYAEMSTFIHQTWMAHKTDLRDCNCSRVEIDKVEEYMTYDGISVSKVYYLLYVNKTLVVAENTNYVTPNGQDFNMTVVGDSKFHFKVFLKTEKLLRYRFHYSVDIEGLVYPRDLQAEIITSWIDAYPDFTGCNCLHAEFVKERYVGLNGIRVTRVVYFMYVNITGEDKIITTNRKPGGPSETTFKNNLEVSRPTGGSYKLYTASVPDRYSSTLQLYVRGRVDRADYASFQTKLEIFYTHYVSRWTTVSVEIIGSELHTSVDGNYVTNLIYLIHVNGFMINSYVVILPEVQELQNTLLTLQHRNCSPYVLYAGGLTDLYISASLYSVNIYGYLRQVDKVLMEATIASIWGPGHSVKILMQTKYIERDGTVVTALHYHLSMVTFNMHSFNMAVFRQLLVTRFRFSQNYKVFTENMTSLLNYDNHFEIILTSHITELDFTGFDQFLLTEWKSRWSHFKSCGCLQVQVITQEKYYTGIEKEKGFVWYLTYFLHDTSTSQYVFPEFVPNVNQYNLMTSFHVQSLAGHSYALYEGLQEKLYSDTKHFSLYIKQSVSQLDWDLIKSDLLLAWKTNHPEYMTCNCLSIKFKEQHQLIDVKGNFVWRIIYFLWNNSTVVDSNVAVSLNHKFNFSFKSVYGYTYSLATVDLSSHSHRWLSRLFPLLSNHMISSSNLHVFEMAILLTWQHTYQVLLNCGCLRVHFVRQTKYEGTSESYHWEMSYYMTYYGKTITFSSWPLIDTTILGNYIPFKSASGLSYKFKAISNWSHYYSGYRIYLNHKIIDTDKANVEGAILNAWLSNNHEYASCHCVHAVLGIQKEIIDEHGQSHWKAAYNIEINGTAVRTDTYVPLNETALHNTIANMMSLTKYAVERTSTFGVKEHSGFVSTDYFWGLLIHDWVPKTDYAKFSLAIKDSLMEKWANLTGGSNVTVQIHDLRQQVDVDGHSLWKLRYTVRVNGELVYPSFYPEVDIASLQNNLHFNNIHGGSYRLVASKTVKTLDYSRLHWIYLNHKVPTGLWSRLSLALTNSWYGTRSDYKNCQCLAIRIVHQEEVTGDKRSTWKIGYSMTVNSTLVDSLSIPALTSSILNTHLKFRGPNGVKYMVADVNHAKMITSLKRFSFYLNHYVTDLDRHTMETVIANTWKQMLGHADIGVTLLHQKEYLDLDGHSQWKVEYSVSVNSTSQLTVELPVLSLAMLSSNLGVAFPSLRYAVRMAHAGFYEYNSHFSLYVKTQVALEHYSLFKLHLKDAWLMTNAEWRTCNCIEVHIVTQLEMLDKIGHSVWNLVYFITMNGTIVDSRNVVSGMNSTMLNEHVQVTGHLGLYHFLLSTETYLPYSGSFHLMFNGLFDLTSENQLKIIIVNALRATNPELQNEVNFEIEILRKQQEYITFTWKKAWKLIFYARKNGVYLHSSDLISLNMTQLEHDLAQIKGPQGQSFRLVVGTEFLQYRHHFAVYLKQKVQMEGTLKTNFVYSIKQSWEEYKNDYRTCGCIAVNIAGVEEVVDHVGYSYWRIVYFLSVNSTVINSMISADLAVTTLHRHIIAISHVSGGIYEPVAIHEETYKTENAFHFYLTSEVGIYEKKKFKSSVKEAWKLMHPEYSTCDCLDVKINRQTAFYMASTWELIWRVEYYIFMNTDIVSPVQLQPQNLTILQNHINFTAPGSSMYAIANVAAMTSLDYRFSFALHVKSEVRVSDYTKFQEAIIAVWNETRVDTKFGMIEVDIRNKVSRVVDIEGIVYTKLVIFIKQGGVLLDSRVMPTLNKKLLKTHIAFHGPKGPYELISLDNIEVYQTRNMFSLHLSTPLKEEHRHLMLLSLSNMWSTYLQTFDYHVSVTLVAISKQQEFVTVEGESRYQLSYFLRIGNALVSVNQIQMVTNALLETAVSSVSASYHLVPPAGLIAYETYFSLYLKKAVEFRDRAEFQHQINLVWNTTFSGHLAVKIVKQEELIISGSSSWRLLYLLTTDQLHQDSRLFEYINTTSLGSALTSVPYLSKYTQYFQIVDPETSMHYNDLFFIYLQGEIGLSSYGNLQTGLESIWNMGVNATDRRDVKIEQQESVWSSASGHRYQKIMYSLKHKKRVLSARFFNNLSEKQIENNVTDNMLFGKYVIAKESNMVTVRSSYGFSIYLSRRIYKADVVMFQNAVLDSFATIRPDIHRQLISIKLHTEQHYVDAKGKPVWKQSFFITAVHTLNANMESAIDVAKLTSYITFISPRGETYIIYSTGTSTKYYDADLQQSVMIKGRLSLDAVNLFRNRLLMLWRQKYPNDINVHVTIGIPEELFDSVSGELYTKISYSVYNNDALVNPRFASYVLTNGVLPWPYNNTQYEVVSAVAEIPFASTFSLYLNAQPGFTDNNALISVLESSWAENNNEVNPYLPSIKLQENYIGEYGLQVTEVIYTIFKNDIMLARDVQVEPVNTVVERYLADQKIPWGLYTGSELHRIHASRHVTLKGMVTLKTKATFEGILQSAWIAGMQNEGTCNPCNIIVFIIGKEDIVSSESETLTKLLYSVKLDNKELHSSAFVPFTMAKLSGDMMLANTSEKLWTENSFNIFTLDVKGTVTPTILTTIKNAVQNTWQSHTNNIMTTVQLNTEVTIVKQESYVDETWSKVTRIHYTVKGDQKDIDEYYHTMPQIDDIATAVDKSDVVVHKGVAKKMRKLYVKTTKAALNHTAVETALHKAWLENNTDIKQKLFSILLKKEAPSTRKRRAISTPPELIDQSGNKLSAITFTVSLNGQEPNPLFVYFPTAKDLDRFLQDVNSGLCSKCNPRVTGKLTVQGNTPDADKTKIADAIKAAYHKANPDVPMDKIKVDIIGVDNTLKDSNGDPLSEIRYAVGRHDGGDIEDLNKPKAEMLTSELNNIGKTLFQHAKPKTEAWKIPVIVACSIIAAIIVCIVVATIMVRRSVTEQGYPDDTSRDFGNGSMSLYVRNQQQHWHQFSGAACRRRNESLPKREAAINDDKFDPENFSDSAVFSNPAYSLDDEPEKQRSVYKKSDL